MNVILTNIAIILEIMGLEPTVVSFHGYVRRGFYMRKDGTFLFELPQEYFLNKSTYVFNFLMLLITLGSLLIYLNKN